MATSGIAGLAIETHNWGATVAFWQDLGYELEFETDHHSGQLRHPAGGPFVFVAERPPGHQLEVQPIVLVEDPDGFEAPRSGVVERPFTAQHWDVLELVLLDPDGRRLSLQSPVSEDA